MTKIEQLQEELIREYEKLIKLCNSREFFNIPSVNILKDKLSAFKSQDQSVQMPSDEEISERASIQVSAYLKARNNPTADLHKRFVNMAKWMRKQAKPIDLRSELIQFLSESIIDLPKGKDCIDLVDNYLSNK